MRPKPKLARLRRRPLRFTTVSMCSIAELLAEAIKRIHSEDSVSSLFEM